MSKTLTKKIKIIQNLSRSITVLDIGARGGLGWPWNELSNDLVDCILVEPDPAEAEELLKKFGSNGNVKILPRALWEDERGIELNLNRSPGTSSVFEPNHNFLKQFPDFSRFDLIKKIKLSTTTIDHLIDGNEIPDFDFVKLDIQGGELAVLKGGIDYLKSNIVGLEMEVEFSEIYSGQPLFAEVDTFVREKLGLELWDITKVYWKYERGVKVPGPSKGRLISGDALYFRSISSLEEWLSAMPEGVAKEKLLMLVITSMVFGYTDYANTILMESFCKKILNDETHKILLKTVNSLGKGFRPFRNGNNYIYWIFNVLANAFKVSHQGWATSAGGSLGSRKRGPFWY